MTDRVKTTWNNLKEILLNEQTEILKTAGLLMIPTILTKITGQLFTLLAAAQLPPESAALNEFLLAGEFPELLTNIILLGVIGAVVIPILIDVKNKHGHERFLRVYSTVINISVILFILVTLLVVWLAPEILHFTLVNISRVTELPSDQSFFRIVNMMRVLMIPNLILGISAFVASGLNVYQRFMVPQLAPLFYNLGRIFGVFVLIPLFNESPWALVMGTIIGSVLHLLVQLPLAGYVKLRYVAVIDLQDEYSKKLFRVSLPRVVALAIDQVGTTLTSFIAFGLNKFALAALFYANSLAVIVPSIFGYTFAVASFPTLSGLYANKEYFRVNELIIKSLNQIIFLSLPVVIAMLIMRLPIVRLTYGLLPGTEFDRQSTAVVAWVLLFFTFGLIFLACKWYLFRVFYVAHNTVVPLIVSLIALMLTVVLSVVFSNLFSHSDSFSISGVTVTLENLLTRGEGTAAIGGISLAMSVTYIFEFSVMLFLIDKLVVKLNFSEFWAGVWRKLVAAGVMATVMYFMYKIWDRLAVPIDAAPGFQGSTTLNLLVLTVVTLITSFMVYYLICLLFQVEELKILKRFLNPVLRIGGLKID